MSKILNFFDFDGTLIATPLPDPGKALWEQQHGKPYPHIGWWSKPESLCMDTFTIKPREIAHTAYLKYANDSNAFNYILTSRLQKLKPLLNAILFKNDITAIVDILCAHGSLNKGERIVEILNDYEAEGDIISEINVWEDRNKEIVTIEPFREYFKNKGIALNIYKIESDATD